MRYRAEIDGLRAVAVLPVILFHAHVPFFAGGFVGVDVFFVISGYLITNLIQGEIAEGRFSLLRFYERRIRRILPALLLVMACCAPFAWLWMLPQQLGDFAQSAAAAILFASNLLFWMESGYFAPPAELKPLLHTWSLAIEEQFYLLFPLFLLIMARLPRRALLAALAALTLISLALAEAASRAAPDAAFYLLPFRAWELGAGALLALAIGDRPVAAGLWGQIGAAAGLAMILCATVLFDRTFRIPGLWALVPVLGAALVIAFAAPDGWAGRLLGWRPVTAVGLISYSLYLWHYPLFAFARIRDLGGVYAADHAALIALAFVLAALTWRFVERPFRDRASVSTRTVLVALGAASAVLFALAALTAAGRGWPGRMPAAVTGALAWKDAHSPYRDACLDNRDPLADPACRFGPADAPGLVVWGDSHGAELAWQLAEGEGAQFSVRQLTQSACPPVLGVQRLERPACAAHNRAVFDALTAGEEAGPVVMVARWSRMIGYDGFQYVARPGVRWPGGQFIVQAENGERLAQGPEHDAALGAELRRTVAALQAAGRRVVLVYPIPEADWPVPDRLAQKRWFGVRPDEPMTMPHSVYLERSAAARAEFDQLPASDDLIRIRPDALFCEAAPQGRCVLERNGTPLYFDQHHVNGPGAALLADEIRRQMAEKGWLED